jgi:Leucine-rich repeat (LRR) protein
VKKTFKKTAPDHQPLFRIRFLLVFFVVCFGFPVIPKAQPALTPDEIDEYREQARQLVSFLQFTLNTIGDPEVPVKEKDIIINESFRKFFESDKVQIEDDLVEQRDVPVNKDVQAYLKDIDFFFRNVNFDLRVEEITQEVNEKNQIFFKIQLNRNLKGVTIEGDTVNSNRIRYIEINLDDAEKDLKIASIYTTKLNEKEELRRWWNQLSKSWKAVLGSNVFVTDTIRMKDVLFFNDSLAVLDFLVTMKMSRDTLTLSVDDTLKIIFSDSSYFNVALLDKKLQKIISIDTITIGPDPGIQSLEPLSKLTGLERLDCREAGISDLMPLRNLSHLQYLDCSGTGVVSLDPLRYSNKLERLFLDKTPIRDIAPVAGFEQLQQLHFNNTQIDSLTPVGNLILLNDLECAQTQVTDISALEGLINLERLDISGTSVSDITPLKNLKNLYLLKFENTPVKNLQPLKDLGKLQLLFMDNTPVYDLSPLDGLPELNRIYCDQTGVTRKTANRFMEANPGVLVVFESAELINWWMELPEAWKAYFSDRVSDIHHPEKEELHKLTRIKNIDLSGIKEITTLQPVLNLSILNRLDCSGTSVRDIDPLRKLADLNFLDFSNTEVSDISALARLTNLNELRFDHTAVTDISSIMKLDELKLVYCDDTPVNRRQVVEFINTHPDCLIVYHTEELQQWWDTVPGVWKLLAEKYIKTNEKLNREQLHEIARLRKIDLSDFPEMARQSFQIKSLESIQQLIFLQELSFTNTGITSLEPLRGMKSLKVLRCPNNPIETLEPLSEVSNLEELDVQNTPVRSLEFLSTLDNLKKLNCSGTLIKSLKGVEYLQSLEELECYNTAIRSLKYAGNLENLRLIKCYNTRISKRTIEKFRETHSGIEVIYY